MVLEGGAEHEPDLELLLAVLPQGGEYRYSVVRPCSAWTRSAGGTWVLSSEDHQVEGEAADHRQPPRRLPNAGVRRRRPRNRGGARCTADVPRQIPRRCVSCKSVVSPSSGRISGTPMLTRRISRNTSCAWIRRDSAVPAGTASERRLRRGLRLPDPVQGVSRHSDRRAVMRRSSHRTAVRSYWRCGYPRHRLGRRASTAAMHSACLKALCVALREGPSA